MLFSKSCIYGIRSVLLLAVENEKHFISIKEIANKLDIPFHFLTKILQSLGNANILESAKGPKGGVALKVPSEEISIMNIICALDGDRLFRNCMMDIHGCSEDNPCILHKSWHKTKSELEKDFQTDTVALLAKRIKSGKSRLYGIKKDTSLS